MHEVYDAEGDKPGREMAFDHDDFARLSATAGAAAQAATVFGSGVVGGDQENAMVLAREFYVLAWRVLSDGAVEASLGRHC